MGIVGISFSAASVALFSLTDFHKRFVQLKVLDILLHFLGAASFIFCGAAVLYSTLIIMTSIQNCCREKFEQVSGLCELDGFLDGLIQGSQKSKELPVPVSRFKIEMYNIGVRLPNEVSYCVDTAIAGKDDWKCTLCINNQVQPMYVVKGVAGALGILTSIFYLVVAIVSIGDMKKLAKESARINAGLRRSAFN